MKNNHKATIDIMYHAFFRLCAYTGMRRGEITVLDWKHLDTRNNVLFIGFSLKITECDFILGGTKTKDDRNIYRD